MNSNASIREYFDNDRMKIDVFKAKYLPEDMSDLEEDQIMMGDYFKRLAEEVCTVSIENDSDTWVAQWSQELYSDMWRPGGSILSGLLRNSKKISLFNCTTIPIEGDSLEHISKARYACMKVAAHRQGLGVDFSKLRPRGMPIHNSAEISQGVVHWMESFNNIGNEVGQLGRRPAMLFSLSIHHPDIEEFISCKDDLRKINNANISVQITDEFMKCLQSNGQWTVSFVNSLYGHEVKKTYDATYLFKKLAESAWKTGEPGIQFIDLMNRYSIQKALGYDIISTNACSEKPLPPYSVCGLASINMEKVPHFSNRNEMNEYVKNIAYSIVRFMDDVIEYELEHPYKNPLIQQAAVVRDLREIGIGVTNINKWLFDQNIPYDSEDAIEILEYFFDKLSYYAFCASVELAKERGPCPAWERMSKERKLEKNVTQFLENLFQRHPDCREMYFNHGLRNGSLLSIAPTGSISMTFSSDVLSSGIEPAIGWYYWRRTRAVNKGQWDYYFVIPKTIKNILLKKIPQDSQDWIKINSFSGSVLDNSGTIGKEYIAIIEKYIDKSLLKNVFNIDPFKKLRLIGAVQKYVDAAISVTFNLSEDTTINLIHDLYKKAYYYNIKAVSVYRNNSREGVIYHEFPKTVGCCINISNYNRPDNIQLCFAPKRPSVLPCEVHRVMKHYVVVGLFNNYPYEIFIVEDNKLPSEGYIHKEKKGKNKYYYFYSVDGQELLCLNAKQVSNETIQAITRLVSSNLRHGVPIDFICEQLAKCGDSINAYPKMLSRVLKKYKLLNISKVVEEEVCPECGNNLIEHDGCISCVNCGFSKCA